MIALILAVIAGVCLYCFPLGTLAIVVAFIVWANLQD
jgi:hypothetical protein